MATGFLLLVSPVRHVGNRVLADHGDVAAIDLGDVTGFVKENRKVAVLKEAFLTGVGAKAFLDGDLGDAILIDLAVVASEDV